MPNFKIAVDDGTNNDGKAYRLGADESVDGIISPVNLGPNDVWVLHVPQGAEPTPAEVVANGWPLFVYTNPAVAQCQIGSGLSVRDSTKYFLACATGESGSVRGIA